MKEDHWIQQEPGEDILTYKKSKGPLFKLGFDVLILTKEPDGRALGAASSEWDSQALRDAVKHVQRIRTDVIRKQGSYPAADQARVKELIHAFFYISSDPESYRLGGLTEDQYQDASKIVNDLRAIVHQSHIEARRSGRRGKLTRFGDVATRQLRLGELKPRENALKSLYREMHTTEVALRQRTPPEDQETAKRYESERKACFEASMTKSQEWDKRHPWGQGLATALNSSLRPLIEKKIQQKALFPRREDRIRKFVTRHFGLALKDFIIDEGDDTPYWSLGGSPSSILREMHRTPSALEILKRSKEQCLELIRKIENNEPVSTSEFIQRFTKGKR